MELAYSVPGRPPSLPDTSCEKLSPPYSMHASVIPLKPTVDEMLTMGDVFDECIETQSVAPARPSIKVSNLSDRCYVLPNYSIFVASYLTIKSSISRGLLCSSS